MDFEVTLRFHSDQPMSENDLAALGAWVHGVVLAEELDGETLMSTRVRRVES